MNKRINNHGRRSVSFAMIFTFVFMWIFSGWPQIGNFPPEIIYVQAATEILRPNGVGTYQQWDLFDTTHWGATSDQTDTTYIYTNVDEEDDYEVMADPTFGDSDTINWVQINFTAYASGSGGPEKIFNTYRVSSADYEDTKHSITRNSWNDYTGTQHTTHDGVNPWTKALITSMEAGVSVDAVGGTEELRVSEIWVVVDYTAGGGTLTVDIVDSGGTPVASPSITMSAISVSFSFQTPTGTFGTASEKIRVNNGTGTATWTASVAASATTDFWDSAGTDYDFNDPTASAGDGGDDDSLGGQMTVDASGSTITPEGGCSTAGITKGSSASFSEGVTDAITIMSAGATADTGCYWDQTGISISQTVPAEQPAASDYNINIIVSVVAS